ncbi:hypothetical protein [Microterricola viridarii]|uniref:Uncharacterized protein n=1 Tax=Microterricola viridarii TaxID=412690 RepID=A0A109QYK8_9MICO|nr:hypothetical protein [Microterricola viridarii]AMB58575.1 hypothetical protein AWU67_06545 [Microterricola viridarii]
MDIRLKIVGVVVVAGAMMLSAAPALAGTGHGAKPVTCAGGEIVSGSYSDITVTGACSVPSGAVITVSGSITLKKGAVLDAQSAPSTITVGRNVNSVSGALLGLGCQPASLVGNSGHECMVDPTGHSTITVNGDVTAVNTGTLLLNGITVRGNVSALGGGSEIPWSIKNNTITRNVSLVGQTTNWVGILFNKIGANLTLLKIAVTDTDPGAHGAFVVQNNVGKNLSCFAVTPTVTGGLFPGEPLNVVGGRALGQCAALAAS